MEARLRFQGILFLTGNHGQQPINFNSSTKELAIWDLIQQLLTEKSKYEQMYPSNYNGQNLFLSDGTLEKVYFRHPTMAHLRFLIDQ